MNQIQNISKKLVLLFIIGMTSCSITDSSDKPQTDNDNSNTFTDPRDKQIYKIVKIGNQTWFAENLRYAGNIPQVTTSAEWVSIWSYKPTPQPAWANYNNNPANDAVYGKLYNWYAVKTGELCPPGWHIPTFLEWNTLIDFLGGKTIAGAKMKSTTGWSAPDPAVTNGSGFTGRSGGLRHINGEFEGLISDGFWWSSSENGDQSWAYALKSTNNYASQFRWHRPAGFSCRCIKD